MRITVLGTGYVGLVASVCFAETGLEVTGVDVDPDRVARLRSGDVPIWEPGVADLLRTGLSSGRLRFTTDLSAALEGAAAVFLAVGTPSGEDGSADIEQVLVAARQIGATITEPVVIVVKSTVPVGTAARVRSVIEAELHARCLAISFDVVSNPEFLREGSSVEDFRRPDRIVVGIDAGAGDPARARAVLERIHRPYTVDDRPLLVMDTRSAELTKYAANAMLATRISFMNQMAALCDAVGADVARVREGIAADARIGPAFLHAGVGYGGSCLPKDVRALRHIGAVHGVDLPLIDAVEAVNAAQQRIAVDRLRALLGLGPADRFDGTLVAIWGLAFKPDTDDVREAPAVGVIRELLAAGAEVALHDPVAHVHARSLFGDRVRVAASAEDAVEGADALVLLTEWPELRAPEPDRLAARMRGRAVVDGRNVLDGAALAEAGFHVVGIGRPAVAPRVP